MTKLARSTTICWLFFWVLVLAGTSRAQTRPPIVEQVAEAYGLDSFGQIDAVRYTFNLQLSALKLNLSRTWTWEPKTGQVTYEGKDKDGKPVKVTYKRSELSSQPDSVKKDVDPGFTNDNYWFVFPFHAYWDTGATITDEGLHKLPAGSGSATLVSIKYGAALGGYTPGDTWDLYVSKDNRIEYLVFHHGGTVKPSLVRATWAGYKKAGPLLVSTEHRGTADGAPLHLFFSNVAVKLAGSDTWTEAQ
jgi:hypothetical protein